MLKRKNFDQPDFKPDSPEQQRERHYPALEAYGLEVANSPLVTGTPFAESLELDEAEKIFPFGKAYGALPYLEQRDEIIGRFVKEVGPYFGQYFHEDGNDNAPWSRFLYTEGAILHELKFGRPLSEFAQEILANYPDLGKQGKTISLSGLSGSGKSTFARLLRQELGEDTIPMDSDTSRYNLYGKKIKDVESKAGASLDYIRSNLIHNKISGALHLMLQSLPQALKERGYNTVQSTIRPRQWADNVLYIEHPDIHLDDISEENIGESAELLFKRTQARVPEQDNYDWSKAQTITKFEEMPDVAVQVPQFIHEKFIDMLKEDTQNIPDLQIIHNEHIDDPREREEYWREQIKKLGL